MKKNPTVVQLPGGVTLRGLQFKVIDYNEDGSPLTFELLDKGETGGDWRLYADEEAIRKPHQDAVRKRALKWWSEHEEAVEIVRKAYSSEEAHDNLKVTYKLSDDVVDALLECRLVPILEAIEQRKASEETFSGIDRTAQKR